MTIKELYNELSKVIADGYGDYEVECGYGRFEFSGDDYEVDEDDKRVVLAEE